MNAIMIISLIKKTCLLCNFCSLTVCVPRLYNNQIKILKPTDTVYAGNIWLTKIPIDMKFFSVKIDN